MQIPRHGSKETLLLDAVAVGIFHNHAGGNGLLVYVKAAAMAMRFHGASPQPPAKTPAFKDSPLRTLLMEVSFRCSYGVQLHTVIRVLQTAPFGVPGLARRWCSPLSCALLEFSCFVVTGIGHAATVIVSYHEEWIRIISS
jgi:hypothetical protein